MMGPALVITLISAFVVLIAAIIIAVVVYEKRRREALQRIGQAMGLSFQRKDPSVLQQPFGKLHLFNQGHSRKAKNILRGQIEDIEVSLFDYQYTTGGGKNSTTWNQTVAALRLPGRQLPAFQLRPEHLFHKIGAALGFDDIDFDDHPQFSKAYLLRSPQEQAVRDLFNNDVLDFFGTIDKKVCVEADGEWLVMYRQSRRVKADQLAAFLEESFEICTRLG